MCSFTIELISNSPPHLCSDSRLSSFTNFLPEQLNLEGQWETATSEFFYPSLYQNVTEGKFTFFDEKFSKMSEFYYLEPSFYTSITDTLKIITTLFQERQSQRKLYHSQSVSTNSKS